MKVLQVHVPVPPGEIAINRKHATIRTLHDRFRAARDEVILHLRQHWQRPALRCPVTVEIVEHWPSKRGDVDAPIKAVLDALEHAGVVENDKQVTSVTATRAVNGSAGSMLITVHAQQD